MPFGLKNAPATFQRLMDIFRRGLPVLAYLDDVISMSPTFEQHLADSEVVFKRLMDFKLRANREKYRSSCSRVKYLGLWITPQGIEVDHEKTSAILGIPPPKNSEEKAFQTLKQCLVSPPILKQANFSKPFLIRTDASNYALGAVLLQGEDKEEHPIEFASRLLNPAERNYSTTEREALAVFWALNKFRGYIDATVMGQASL
ncbi:retrovirus-related Pol polyprotein from transposon 297 [Trichonephila clavipes]|nr:retrovirus-related Pol polyprotein from transposon 297 [Trichonephila clavipes]